MIHEVDCCDDISVDGLMVGGVASGGDISRVMDGE